MKILRWTAFVLMAVALVACGVPALTAQPVARVDDVSLTQQELDARIKRVQDALVKEQETAQNAPPPPSVDEIKRGVVNLFIEQNLTLGLAKQRDIAVGDEAINGEIERIRGQVEQGGQKLDDIVQGRLGFAGAESTEFRQFVSYLLTQEKLGSTLVTTDTVRQEMTDQIMPQTKEMVEQIDVAHILVETEDEAKKAIERLEAGEDFGALAKELSTDPGSKDNGGEYKGIKRGEFIPEFEKVAFEELKPGEYTKTPVKSQFGYHVIKLIDRTKGPAMSEEQANAAIEQAVDQQVQQRQQQAVQDLVEQERTKAKDEGRLIEPDFLTTTAVPAEQPPAQEQPAPTVQP